MGAVTPIRFSESVGVAPSVLRRLQVTDPFLNLDTKLFIDPMLLAKSRSREMKKADERFHEYFGGVVKLLLATGSADATDPAWRAAVRKLTFKEVRGTCLGYGAGSTRGSAIGPGLAKRLARNGKAIVDKGVTDPDLFLLLALFEDGIGADRISDMTTNVIMPELVGFNERIARRLGVRTKRMTIRGVSGSLVPNPVARGTPVLLVPRDVVRKLPIAADFESAMTLAAVNEELRARVSAKIGNIWKLKVSEAKKEARRLLLTDEKAFSLFLDALRTGSTKAYDFESDPDGVFSWQRLGLEAARRHPPRLSVVTAKTVDDVERVANELVDHFQHLVENEGLYKMLWFKKRPRNEKFVQLLFYAISAYGCRAADIDITPEAETGNGPVDFKLSRGFASRILVELKLSTSKKVIQGYDVQTEVYKKGQRTKRAVYVVIDVGRLGKKDRQLIAAGNRMRAKGQVPSRLVFVDAKPRPSASKRVA
jgi:hypothetical protein